MAFRVSDSTLFNNAVRNTRLNRFALSELQNKLSTGKRINALGDDPSAATEVLGLRRGLARIEQFGRNIEGAKSNLEHTEAALGSLTDVISRLREIAVSADIETGQFDIIKPEVEQLYNEILSISNTNVAGRFIFAGFNTDTAPFSKSNDFTEGVVSVINPSVSYTGDNGVLQVQTSEATTVNSSVTGRVIFFGSADGDDTADTNRVDIFQVVRDLRNRLEDPAAAGNPADLTGDLDLALNQVLQVRGTIGATLNRLEIASSQLTNLSVTLQAQMSAVEDLDLVEAATDLASLENTFQASLAVTGRVIQPSLLNFLG